MAELMMIGCLSLIFNAFSSNQASRPALPRRGKAAADRQALFPAAQDNKNIITEIRIFFNMARDRRRDRSVGLQYMLDK